MGEVIKNNPIQEIQVKYKELESGFKVWLSKQSLPVEAAVVTATSSLQGAAIGGLMGSFTSDLSLPTPPGGSTTSPMASLQQAQALSGGPLIQARNFAVMTGVNAGISCVLKRLRGGKEDVQSSMAAAFGSGAVFTLVSSNGIGGPNLAANALSSGLLFALMQGGLFKLGEKFSKPPTEDVLYTKTRVLCEMSKSLLDQDFLLLITYKGTLSSTKGKELGEHSCLRNFMFHDIKDTIVPVVM